VPLTYIGAALSLLGVVLTLVQIDAIRDTIEDDNPSISASEVDTAVILFLLFRPESTRFYDFRSRT
jgi:hypothetical protein